MNESATYYRNLSLIGILLFVSLIVIQIFWMKRTLDLNNAEHQLALEKIIPDIALEVNALNHNSFHDADQLLKNLDVQDIEQIIQKHFKKNTIPTNDTPAFALFNEEGSLFLSNAPNLARELKASQAKVCMSCIVSFSISNASPQKEGETDKKYYDRLMKEQEFQYYSPIESLTSSKENVLYLSIYQEKSIWQSVASLWYLFVGGILFNTLLLLLFYHLLKSLSSYKRITEVKDDFFNNMTHEFKTPLSSILLASRILKKNPDAENSQTYIQLIEKESLFLENQIDRLLEFSLLDNGKIELNQVEITISELFEKVKKRMLPLIKDQNAAVSISIDPIHQTMMGDPIHLNNCFCNLIENSLKYGQDGILIQIHVSKQQANTKISVKDNGPGIDPEHSVKIFDRFYRAQKGNNYQTKGFGIGLSYVKNIVELHNGSIALRSNKSVGTEFTITI